MQLSRIFHHILNCIYPPACALCDARVEEHGGVCNSCVPRLQRLEGDANFVHLEKKWFAKARSVFAYDGKIKDAIHNFKYNERFDILKFLCIELGAQMKNFDEIDFVVPVPMHGKKLGHRGFSPVALIVKKIAKMENVPMLLTAIQRVKDVPPQVGLPREERIKNVKGVFVVSEKCEAAIAGKNILIIDDVITTGSTVNECARALIKSRAKSVSILSIARTI